jgi:uncharacterized membrane protein YhhN
MLIWKIFIWLSLIVWIGGIIFFAFVLAPTVFNVLPTRELAGNVVTRALTLLHWIGIVSGVVFLLSSIAYSRAKFAYSKPFSPVNVLIALMLALILLSQFSITPRMKTLRTEMGTIDNVPVNDARRTEFNRLHNWSTRAEGGVLFLGLAVVVLTARRFA